MIMTMQQTCEETIFQHLNRVDKKENHKVQVFLQLEDQNIERWHCGAIGNGMDKDSKGQRKLEDWRRATSSRGRSQPRIEQNRIV